MSWKTIETHANESSTNILIPTNREEVCFIFLNFSTEDRYFEFPVFCCSTEHSFGHSYAVAVAFNNGTFNEDICISASFMLMELFMGQGIIITVTALSGENKAIAFLNRMLTSFK